MVYKVSNYYAPQADAGVLWSDPDLGIDWPVSHKNAIISEKDSRVTTVQKYRKHFSNTRLVFGGILHMRVIVTGGAGFIGSALVRYLVQRSQLARHKRR